MENLIAIVVVAVVIVFLFFLIRRPASNEIAPLEKPQHRPQKPKAQRFQSETRKRTAGHKVLQGPAYVIDGDSIVIQKTQVRLFGVDAPEMNHPYGKNAKWALVKLCKGHKVKAVVKETDAHGRTVAHCHLPDGRDLSAEMVKLGLAIDWPKYSGGKYRSLEVEDSRKKMWLADARQKGRMHVWKQYEDKQRAKVNQG